MSLPVFEFHISRRARDRYQFDDALFATSGNVIFANFHAARLFAQKMNQKRDLARFPEQAIPAGQINAMGLIDEILHLVANVYRQQYGQHIMADALEWLNGTLGKEQVEIALCHFVQDFPPVAIYRHQLSLDEYLDGATGGVPNRQIVLEEMLLLWLANANPAFTPYNELFDDSLLIKESAYVKIPSLLYAFFDTQPLFGPDNQNLIDMLRAPAIASPHSLSGQLEYIRQRWSVLLGKYLFRLLSSLDFIKEEEKTLAGGGLGGPGPARVYEFGGQEVEAERFSPDKDWMPRLILMAKNAFVWLDQLSKKYRRPIKTLADIPDEELDALAQWGFTGLWLIGLWERSSASKEIKVRRGNPDAVASAYSLYDYQIAWDLGSDAAYQNLHERCWVRGIRLASDMVPNHMGIDSRWLVDHPDWFIGLDYSPFPSYSFNGSNFSGVDRIGIFLEDHYFNNTDAAVVFKRVDFTNGQTKYIYHGNDGTSMPWNDTAQLNYLNPEVREAVIQTILQVARKFPVIRFDAAMTLAKKHFQRLWFPEPGTGGAIPSRAEYGLTKEQFDAAMPIEFWREVVDRVAQEVPDTLLLAEAFWLMEGYFVRTLGMHRVYNSAFMNMLRDEKNAEYRLVMKNTLEFDPEILKRYVNFMNNPDERTAVDQFGKGDKYFGICTVMVTLPGLPMFGHGQIEGYTEKYGMEYRRAYWEEQPDGWLVDRHLREVFPLLRKRYLFAEVKDFWLYDFYTPEGRVNEDVFAYSNRAGEECSLVVYHNRFSSTRGWIRTSAACAQKSESGEKRLVQKSLAEGLQLDSGEETFTIFRDQFSGLEYIRSNRELWEQGLYVELEAYKCRVFLDFRQVADNEWHQYRGLANYLQGRGVPDIDEALKEIFLQPIHQPFRELANAGYFRWVIRNRARPDLEQEELSPQAEMTLNEAHHKMLMLLNEIKRQTESQGNPALLATQTRHKLETALRLPLLMKSYGISLALIPTVPGIVPRRETNDDSQPATPPAETPLPVDALATGNTVAWATLLAWLFTHPLGEIAATGATAEVSRSWMDEWLFAKLCAGAFADLGMAEDESWRALNLVKVLIRYQNWWKEYRATPSPSPKLLMESWLADSEVQAYLHINRYQDILWYNREAFEDLRRWLLVIAMIGLHAASRPEDANTLTAEMAALAKFMQALQAAEEASGYQVEKLLEAL